MSELLNNINSPDDLKKLSLIQLYELSDELREFIIENVSVTGGHLASNLGVVELTIALNLMFDFSKDRLTWDVGHQSYIHKIITGRKDQIPTLRTLGGLSGFPKVSESVYDAFNTGHSSTSISASLGMARARDIKGDDYNVVAVIGDGALSGGMAFEALNDAGSSNTNMIIILNDNGMSINTNVGGMSAHLMKLSSQPGYTRLKKRVRSRLLKIPKLGKKLVKVFTRMKEGFKHLVTDSVIFDDLGIKYIGPIDGHNIKQLCETIELAKNNEGPILIHVKTVKGKGYKPAEDMPEKYHGISPYNEQTGNIIKAGNGCSSVKVESNSRCFGNTLCELAEKNKDIVAISAAMVDGTGLDDFSNQYPDRLFDVGITEQHAVTLAAGFATQGITPVVAIYSTFLQRAYDQLFHDVALQKLHVVFAIDRAGVVGEDGETHQGIYDLSYMLTMPNFTVLSPVSQFELKAMFKYAINEADGPVSIRYPKGVLKLPCEDDKDSFEIFKGDILRDGSDVTIVATGAMVERALAAAELLSTKNISCEVINIKAIKPLDVDTIKNSVLKTGKLVSVEDNVVTGGFGMYVLEELARLIVNVPSLQLGLPDKAIPHGKRSEVLEQYNLDAAGIAEAVLGWEALAGPVDTYI